MSTPTYFFQVSVSSLARSRVFSSSFVSRACSRTAIESRIAARQPARCLSAPSSDSKQSSDSTQPEASSSAPISPASPVQPPQQPSSLEARHNQEALLEAFESYIDEFEVEAEENLSPSERRKLAADQKLSEIRKAHERRLDVLSALPHELVVEPVRNKCPGCGTVLQSNSPDRPGYLPQTTVEGKPAKSILLYDDDNEQADPIPVPVDAKPREPVCQRCYRLTHYGTIEPHLRVQTKNVTAVPVSASGVLKPSTSNELSPSKFRKCLERLRNLNAVVIYLIDIFDFHGTFISSLRDIIGLKNPVVLALNKTDLLPSNYKPARVEGWIQHECAAMGLLEVAGIHLISSTKGTGVKVLLADAMRIAKLRRSDIYVIGAANVGKSSFINQLIRLRKKDRKPRGEDASRKGNKNRKPDSAGAITTSVVPGTTLDVIRIPLGGKISLFDTPGLMMPHQLTNYLDEKELRAVLPSKNVEHVTFRLGEGKALYIGGLARVEIVSGRPFFFTCFFSPMVKLHPGKMEDADEFTRRHVGEMLTPPYSEERFLNLGEWTSKSFTAEGEGWKKASVDIVLSGLGWIAVTGPGSVRLRICVPKGVGVFTREPLMPFEVQTGVSKYTGTAAVNRKQIKKATRKRKNARAEEW